ncbi:uncharacterized protein LOC113377724 [Ctenocephalides felis]|uniref:uncharacterized protein LOC113377724 n=1 Tax=Ctenocephalides felis TaxID=7515 RepID=UPI000E6E4E22|nr:uncharacterized protein LOC113377724 [Ctenocephalides felis]
MSRRSSKQYSAELRGSKIKQSRASKSSKISVTSSTKQASPSIIVNKSNLDLHTEFINQLQKEIYDYTFEKIFIKYLEKQAIKQTVHCATEAMIKIIAWNYLRADTGEQISEFDVFKNDEKPSLSIKDALTENGNMIDENISQLVRSSLISKFLNKGEHE